MDQSIRSYRGKKWAWWKAVQRIYDALGEIFTYDYPLCSTYLSKYLKGAVKNDRLEWREFFFANRGAQHDCCPDEAFGTLQKYWLSVAGKEESESMIAHRAFGPRKTNSSQGPMSTTPSNPQVIFYTHSLSTGMEEFDKLYVFTD